MLNEVVLLVLSLLLFFTSFVEVSLRFGSGFLKLLGKKTFAAEAAPTKRPNPINGGANTETKGGVGGRGRSLVLYSRLLALCFYPPIKVIAVSLGLEREFDRFAVAAASVDGGEELDRVATF